MWNHVENLAPPEDQPVLVMHSEYATPIVMKWKDCHWWIAHANGDISRLPRLLSPPLHTHTIAGQIAARENMNRERFDYVLGPSPKMLTDKGKNYLLNYVGLKEAYDEAVKACPIAADAIVALIWDAHREMVTLQHLERDLRERT